MSESNVVLLIFLVLPVLSAFGLVKLFRFYRRSAGKLVLLAGNLVLLVFFLSAALLGAEVYYRFAYHTTDGYQFGRISERWIARHYEFNNFDLRDDADYSPVVPDGKTRVSFIGDSYTNGHGVEKVGDRFTNLLRARHPEWDVHMLARDGMDSGAIADQLGERIRRGYQLDRVVYVYCLNDISDLIPELGHAAERIYDHDPGFLIRNSFFLNTYYYRYLIYFDPELRKYFDYLNAAYRDQRWSVQRMRLRRIHELVAANGGRLHVVTFPFFERSDSPAFREIHRRLGEFWSELGVPHLDLTAAFENLELDELAVNAHDTHPNEWAHSIAAETIDRFLEQSR